MCDVGGMLYLSQISFLIWKNESIAPILWGLVLGFNGINILARRLILTTKMCLLKHLYMLYIYISLTHGEQIIKYDHEFEQIWGDYTTIQSNCVEDTQV